MRDNYSLLSLISNFRGVEKIYFSSNPSILRPCLVVAALCKAWGIFIPSALAQGDNSSVVRLSCVRRRSRRALEILRFGNAPMMLSSFLLNLCLKPFWRRVCYIKKRPLCAATKDYNLSRVCVKKICEVQLGGQLFYVNNVYLFKCRPRAPFCRCPRPNGPFNCPIHPITRQMLRLFGR